MTYQVTSFIKHAEQDIFASGGRPETISVGVVHIRFENKDRAALLACLMAHFNVGRAAMELDADDTPGRIDLARVENGEGDIPSPVELALWKNGELSLWQVTYTGQLEYFGPVEWAPAALKVTKAEGKT